jgi:hypothetical protein
MNNKNGSIENISWTFRIGAGVICIISLITAILMAVLVIIEPFDIIYVLGIFLCSLVTFYTGKLLFIGRN